MYHEVTVAYAEPVTAAAIYALTTALKLEGCAGYTVNWTAQRDAITVTFLFLYRTDAEAAEKLFK